MPEDTAPPVPAFELHVFEGRTALERWPVSNRPYGCYNVGDFYMIGTKGYQIMGISHGGRQFVANGVTYHSRLTSVSVRRLAPTEDNPVPWPW